MQPQRNKDKANFLPLTVDAQGKKTARVIKRVSCRKRKGHKREEKDGKDGENGKEDTARRKQV